jgi:hypothetical protein
VYAYVVALIGIGVGVGNQLVRFRVSVGLSGERNVVYAGCAMMLKLRGCVDFGRGL